MARPRRLRVADARACADHVLRARAHAVRPALYAIGGSERVAFLAGVPTGKLKIARLRGRRPARRRRGDLRARPDRRRQPLLRARTAAAGLCRRLSERHHLSAGLLQCSRDRGRHHPAGGRLQRTEPARRTFLGPADLQRRRAAPRGRHRAGRKPPHQELKGARALRP